MTMTAPEDPAANAAPSDTKKDGRSGGGGKALSDAANKQDKKKRAKAKKEGVGGGASDRGKKGKSKADKDGKDGADMTKVVIRRLPPSMTESSFMEQVSPLPEHRHLYFVEADKSLEPHAFSRAYVDFTDPRDVLTFLERFDGYVFVDSVKGQEYPAMVEFAPYQRSKQGGRKKDPKAGTIEEDPEYVEFVQSLEEGAKGTVSLDQQLAEIESKEKERKAAEKATPLLEFLKEKRAEKSRFREEKREAKRRKEEERKRRRQEEAKRKRDDGPREDGGDEGGKDDKGEAASSKTFYNSSMEFTPRKGRGGGKGGAGSGRGQQQQQQQQRDQAAKGGAAKKVAKEDANAREKGSSAQEKERKSKKEDDRKRQKQKQKAKDSRVQPEKALDERTLPTKDSGGNDKSSGQHRGASASSLAEAPPEPTKQDKAVNKPKRYSDRRKEDRVKRDHDEGDGSVGASGGGQHQAVGRLAEEVEAVKIAADAQSGGGNGSRRGSKGGKSGEEGDDEERQRRQQEVKAKRERERQERKERLKNKERPTMQIYRPGMGKFSSQTIKKQPGQETEKEVPAESAGEPETGRGAGGCGRGGGRGGRGGRGRGKSYGRSRAADKEGREDQQNDRDILVVPPE